MLVTGGTGFIGREIVPHLLQAGHELTLAIRNEQLLPPEWRADPSVRVLAPLDLAAAELAEVFKDVETVVHLAGLAGAGAATSDDSFDGANAGITKRLVASAAAAGVGKFIHLSSIMAVTANFSTATIDDQTAAQPHGAYGRSKLLAEQHVATLAENDECLAVSLRPPLVIGAGARGNWRFLQQLAATGWPLPFASLHGERSFIGVGTLAEAILLLCGTEPDAAPSGSYCIADPEPLTVPQVMSALRGGMGLRPRLLPFPSAGFAVLGALTGRRQQVASLTGSLRVDPSRFFETFGFSPSLPLRQAIAQSGAAYVAARRTGGAAAIE